ncbi:cytochrome P450 [Mycolicibacterium aubagnense]|uniref:Cytochrome P450 128 n=1 Tax=Mycolicibacterium aubagnense TaxID=319707 RepID=A0ABM7IHS4_9MYCO|nr:cytochrome P450 [Mycolicibacterium aubagnense]WGI32147.1 cytochrome P450 [Mycolicibacterium aubagnense]BBX86319.1 putative cytochrome P450 128 [Mycolicibacterium aubagnense]
MSTTTIAQASRGGASVLSPLIAAGRLNVSAAVRARRLGYRAWIGAINTDYDPLDPGTAASPYDAYAALHRGGRVHYSPRRSTWILHRLDDVRAALRDTAEVTSSQGVTRIQMVADLVVLTDDDLHGRLRKQVQPAFTKGALDGWRAVIDGLAAEFVDDLIANPGADAVQRLTVPLPLRVIAAIIGVPDRDIADFRRWSDESTRLINFTPTVPGLIGTAKSMRAAIALRRYFLRHLKAGELKGSETVLGRLVQHSADGALTDEALFQIAILLLIAGNETTTNLLGGMLDTYANNPDQYEIIRANPDLIPQAIEEHVRYTSPVQNLYRYTRAPYRVGEVTIPTGSRVLLSFGAANRDPLAFDDPNSFRAERNPRTHVGFGFGAHLCLGAPLARMEAHAVLRELVTRVSRISTTEQTMWSTNSSLRGPTRLPVVLHA